ncbi:hypothetical protein P8452_67998 [Trifolium repens]|nr:hypothetical protein P8452_67998 [Trifolium repens]
MGPKGPKEKMNGRLRKYEAELKRRREEKLIVCLRLKNHHPSFELPFQIVKFLTFLFDVALFMLSISQITSFFKGNRHRRKTNSSAVGSSLHDAAEEMKTSSLRNKFEEASWE